MSEGLKKYRVWSLRRYRTGGDGMFWTRAGIAVRNRDGSLKVFLDVLPLEGTLVLREMPEGKADEADDPATDLPPNEANQSMGGH